MALISESADRRKKQAYRRPTLATQSLQRPALLMITCGLGESVCGGACCAQFCCTDTQVCVATSNDCPPP